MRGDLEQMVGRIKDAGLEMDRATVDALDADLAATQQRFDNLADLLANDPLVAIARNLPQTESNVKGADAIVSAAGELLGAADDGLAIGRRFVEIKEAQAANPAGGSALSQLVELVATSREPIAGVVAAIRSARATLAGVPDGLLPQLEDARDAMITRLDEYGPIVDTLSQVSGPLPAILGWDAPRRYLVLTQNPAELRPTGGYTGSYGIIAFDKGRITEATFRDIYQLDLPWDYPFIAAPQALQDNLLGDTQPWQLADANWSPDFPTSARDAIALYENESGDTKIDGVFAITTWTIDELLKITGPITVPDSNLTIAPGETTLKLMQAIWQAAAAGSTNRKAVLGPFAQRLFAALLGLPPKSWTTLAGDAETFRRDRLVLAWLKDPAAQALVVAGRLRRRRPPGCRRLPLPGQFERRPHLQAERRHHPLAGPAGADRRVRERPGPAPGHVGQRDRDRRGEPVPGAARRGRPAAPGHVLPAHGAGAQPRGRGLGRGRRAPERPVRRGGRRRPHGHQQLPQDPGRQHEPHVRLDEPLRRQRGRDRRHLPADDPEAAGRPARAAGAHHPCPRGLQDHGGQPGADRQRGHRHPPGHLRPRPHRGPDVRPGGRALTRESWPRVAEPARMTPSWRGA